MDQAFVKTFERAAKDLGLRVEARPGGAQCLLFEGASLGALVAPERCEILTWLKVTGHDPETFYNFRSALPSAPAPLMFNAENYGAALERLAILLAQVSKEMLGNRDQFLARLTTEYYDAIQTNREADIRQQANEAWNAGEQIRAAGLYGQLSKLTAAEKKKIELAEKSRA